MNRRRFLEYAVPVGVMLGTGGFLSVSRTIQAREALASKLLNDAPPLATKELQELPRRAREEILRFFDGKCLNAEGFVSHICSASFAQQLGRCRTEEDQQACFFAAFCGRVATEEKILNQIDTIAAELGSELNAVWGTYCTELSAKWNTHIKEYGDPLNADALTTRVSVMIRSEMAEVIREATKAKRPTVVQAIDNVGKSAVLLLPLVRFGKVGLLVGIPAFFLLAAKHVLDSVLARLEDRRADLQNVISEKIADLGKLIGMAFEKEIKERLADLHAWQKHSVQETARQLAIEHIGFIW